MRRKRFACNRLPKRREHSTSVGDLMGMCLLNAVYTSSVLDQTFLLL